jgi:hypothetical protein
MKELHVNLNWLDDEGHAAVWCGAGCLPLPQPQGDWTGFVAMAELFELGRLYHAIQALKDL